jgi:serine-type D-Ala-D-Ala carboxypeptidase/endopeptidase (penicillin-binding protein 4)
MITPKKILYTLLLTLSLLVQACTTFRQEPILEQNRIDSLLALDFFKSSQAAISVYDLTENKSIYQHNEKLLLRPASNQKILTSGAALLFLGDDYNFKTSAYHTGEIKDSVCNGDIYITGGFDPDFRSTDLDSLVRIIKLSGINGITGNIYADVSSMDSLFWGKGWMWDDDPESFAAYLTPLTINKNSIRIIARPNDIAKPAIIELIPRTNYFMIENSSVTVDTGKTTLKITRDWINRNNKIVINGNLLKSAVPDTVQLNVFNPAFYFLNLMKESFERNGISFNGKVDTLTLTKDAVFISSYKRSIIPVIVNTNKTSDNLSAELLLRTLSLSFSSKHASAKKGIVLVDSLITLAGLNPKNYMIVDGSGLSFYNLLSAEALTGVLKYFYYKQPKIFKLLFNSFPISGYDGTLKNRMKETSTFKHVFAKTGSFSGVNNLSGYLTSSNDHLIAFSILIQNYNGGSNQARSIQDNICKIIFETN